MSKADQATYDFLEQNWDLVIVPAIEKAVTAWLDENYDIVTCAIQAGVDDSFTRNDRVQTAIRHGVEAAMADFLKWNDNVLTAIRDGTRR